MIYELIETVFSSAVNSDFGARRLTRVSKYINTAA